MLNIEMSDVVGVLQTCTGQLAVIGIALVVLVAVAILCRKLKKSKKFMIRAQAVVAAVLAIGVSINSICFGPMSSMIALATGNGTIAEETSNQAIELCNEIADEGIVLLENKDAALPLKTNSNLNVFGWASTDPIYGGSGSGSISDSYEKVDLLEGLEQAGFHLNKELSDFYTAYREARPVQRTTGADMDVEWTLPEPPADTYSDEMIENAKAFSDTALIVIARAGGEGVDLPTDVNNWFVGEYNNNSTEYNDFADGEHYLQLSQTEKNLVNMVCENFSNVIVVYNGANTLEMGFVEQYPQIKGLIWCPGPGQTGFTALGEILNGEVNPSAKTSDIIVRDLTRTPAYNNIGRFFYDNVSDLTVTAAFAGGGTAQEIVPAFVNYAEGIYTGYRFYETAAEEGLIDYDSEVQYPFGYGLSYTSFTQKMGELSVQGETVNFDVTVTNTGSVAGKDIVEVYYNPPYTNGGIEKAAANLVAFEKTGMIEPGQSQTLTVSFNLEDMASYDAEGNKAYVLEAGDYKISIRSDSHTILEEKTYVQPGTVVYNGENKRSTDQVAATNQFDAARGNFTLLSRADHFANYEEATAAPSNYSMSDEARANFTNTEIYKPEEHNDPEDVMPVTGADNAVMLVDLRGKDYDDPQWEKLLDKLTVKEMDSLIALAGYQTLDIDSIGKVRTNDCDGPASINNNFTGVGSVGFPCGVVIANTWNKDMAKRLGESIGQMANELDVSGWYAPAMNGHRSAFSGRNFEYYSEDPYLSGKMAAAAVAGAREHGVYAYIKHFALNDQESNRHNMLNTWVDEQTMREIYLKPFELAVKEGGAQAVMTAFNYIGTTWCGANDSLLNKVLREEWGFRGMALTDYFGRTYFMNADQAIRNGNDAMLVAYDTETNHVKDQESATSVQAMRQASKNILYTVVNSRAYAEENLQTGPLPWGKAAYCIDGALIILLAAVEVFYIRKGYLKRKKEETAA